MNRDLMRVLMLALLAFVLILAGKTRAGELELSASNQYGVKCGGMVETHCVSE